MNKAALVLKADKLALAGKKAEALDAYREALRQVSDKKDQAEIRLKAARCLHTEGNFPGALGEIGIARKLLPEGDSSVLTGKLLAITAAIEGDLSQYKQAQLHAQTGYEILRNTGENEYVGLVLRTLSRLSFYAGDLRESKRLLSMSTAALERAGSLEKEIIKNYNILAQWCFEKSDDQAVQYLEEAFQISKRFGLVRWNQVITMNLGTVCRKTGEWDKAESNLTSALADFERASHKELSAQASISLGRLYILRRDFNNALNLLKGAKDLSKGNFPRELAISLESLGEIAYERKDYKRAEEHYLKALRIGEGIAPEGDIINQVCRRLADLYAAIGEADTAIGYAQRALEVSLKLGDRFEEGCCYRSLAMSYDLKGDKQKAEEMFSQAISTLKAIKDRFELGRTLIESGKFIIANLKDKARGFEQLREAEKLFRGIGSGANWYRGLAKLEMAQGEILLSRSDGASKSLEEAEAIFQELEDKDRLNKVVKLWSRVDALLARANTPEGNIYLAFRGLETRSSSEKGLKEYLERLLKILAQKVGADRVFVAMRNDGCETLQAIGRAKIRKEETGRILSLLTNKGNFDLTPGNFLVKAHINGEFPFLRAGSLMVMPLGLGERLNGVLYVDREAGGEAFRRDEVNFFVAFSERIGQVISEIRAEGLEGENLVLRAYQVADRHGFPRLITDNRRIKEVLRKVEKVKDVKNIVLLSGETGTGKELVAKLIHYGSQRATGPLVAFNLGAIPEELFESELFGHAKGAFTGANQARKGRFEEADGGTLFLDDINTLRFDLQPKLLRVLQEGKIRRVGENGLREVDVRVIAATNQELKGEVRNGNFRDDLFYRLNCFGIKLPPLRERKDDIPLLVSYFVERFNRENGYKQIKGITPEVVEMLMDYDWPGNVRELKNLINRVLTLTDEGDIITPDKLEIVKKQDLPRVRASVATNNTLREKVWQVEKEIITAELKRHGGNKSKAAEALGLSRLGLRKKMARYNKV